MKSQFLIDRNGKQFCLYAGLLDEAHAQGLKQISTELVQIPTNENGNVAICRCEVTTEKGIFTGYGDASPQNVARAMLTCLIRMAETRAKARALRDAINVGVVAFEELDSEGHGGDGDPHPAPTPTGPPTRPGQPRRVGQQTAGPSPDQVRAIQNLSQKTGEKIDLNGVSAAAAAAIISRLQAQARKALS